MNRRATTPHAGLRRMPARFFAANRTLGLLTALAVLLLSGRPLAIPESALEKATAVVACWLPGTEGAGVTDVVFGRTAFSGKLSFAWPKGDHDASHARRHRNALFPLGYGLETPVTMQALSTAPALW